MSEIRAKIIRKNSFGLFIVKVLDSEKQYPFTEDKLDEYYQQNYKETDFPVGAQMCIFIDDEDKVARAHGVYD